ncbi:hypothetical protein [Psychrobacillus sp. NPDC093180]|uniref:hypothetical protein n=1 Tax=Psychrobacillus sp. NPDC093180 TaxID=3364489 RepID=UPI003818023B
MHPTELIELMLVGGVLVLILFLSFLLKGKWRKVTLGLALVYLLSYGVLYVARPYWIDFQIENKVGYLDKYLKEQYPKETWKFRTVPHREDGYKHLNPYNIEVIFEKEPEVKYNYFVADKENIIQAGFSFPHEYKSDLFHLEVE